MKKCKKDVDRNQVGSFWRTQRAVGGCETVTGKMPNTVLKVAYRQTDVWRHDGVPVTAHLSGEVFALQRRWYRGLSNRPLRFFAEAFFFF